MLACSAGGRDKGASKLQRPAPFSLHPIPRHALLLEVLDSGAEWNVLRRERGHSLFHKVNSLLKRNVFSQSDFSRRSWNACCSRTNLGKLNFDLNTGEAASYRFLSKTASPMSLGSSASFRRIIPCWDTSRFLVLGSLVKGCRFYQHPNYAAIFWPIWRLLVKGCRFYQHPN